MSPKVKEEGDVKVGSKRKLADREGDDYKKKRDRNNVAVRKSREKSRAKAKETQERVARLKKENEDLEMKVTLLSKELSILKDLFLSHASGVAQVPDSCPNPKAKAEPSKVEVKQEEVEEEVLIQCETIDIGSPVNVEGFQNDHEYFSHRATVISK